MPHKQNLYKSLKPTSGGKTADLTKSCPKHTNEIIKFFCHDHNALICTVCVTLQHTPTSCHVDYIPDITGQILDSMEFKETLKNIDKLTDKCCQITKDLKHRVANSTTSLKDAITEIENFRKEINKRLDELETKVKNTATKIQHDNNNKLKTTETTCDDINKSLQASADTLKQFNTNKKTDQLFTELKIAQQLILHNENITKQLPTTNDVAEYTFESNQAIKQFLQNEKSLGTLRKKDMNKPAERTNKTAVSMKMSTPRNINAQTSSDKNDCYIIGITVSPQNQLFVADRNNNSIKMIDIKSGTIKQLQLETYPWDITIVARDTLAVTLPKIKTIQFISFSSNSLLLNNKLKVYGECHGISHHQGKLAVTFYIPLNSKSWT
ncbi:FNIP repeat-containing protein DDB_G0290639-like [Ruditapes philippinarum]|uniref:FNIP repeat-containing protein DDB_G0290639-like n=1 Tax=Ruditapes philippinarum TaxID=129788 RepID=UPI00295C05B2|nr:FNIP repeat-containing protein DDB_G0290639-like [Ruditapes philippinarum]